MTKTKERKSLTLVNDHGLWTVEGGNECLGSLLAHEGRVYDAVHGLVDVPPDTVDAHNKLLDQMLVEGLDKNCEVGQGSFFYLTGEPGKPKVTTFEGTVVTEDVTVRNGTITFRRKGKVYRGRMRKDADVFNFRRVA
jgi:hypothetical protein